MRIRGQKFCSSNHVKDFGEMGEAWREDGGGGGIGAI